jgi:hypothetical protein
VSGGSPTAGDDSAATTAPGDVQGLAPCNAAGQQIDCSPATVWPHPTTEYPAASPRSETVIVVPPGSGVVVAPGAPGVVQSPDPRTPLMCPNINMSDPRMC